MCAALTEGHPATVDALFRAGRLDDAIAAANDAVRQAPGKVGQRVLLAELLLFAGRFERVDTVLSAAESIDPSLGLVVSEFRHLLRAEIARQQVWREGRVPEFLGEPTPVLGLSLKAIALSRDGDAAGAEATVAEAESIRPRTPGTHETTAFEDFRDADDVCAGFVEVLTATGRHFWIPTGRIEEAIFHPPRRPRDLFWRRCTMTVRDGPDGDVYVPALYVDLSDDPADPVRLGQATEWSEAAPVRGRGQRVFLAGDDGLAIRDLGSLAFG